jgi:diaminopimelate epimerase
VLTFIEDGLITVNMGVPRHEPSQIPLLVSDEANLYQITIGDNSVSFAAVSIGNPHAVIQVANVDEAPVQSIGSELESHPLFPERANIGFMQIVDRGNIRLRVFERGAGETLACGSGACAAVIAGIEQNLLDEEVRVSLPGGDLVVNWKGRMHPVYMSGSATLVYEGQIEL